MSRLEDLPVAGKYIGRGIQLSTVLHILLICLLITLSVYSHQRIEELTRQKEAQVEKEKQEKIEDAVAEKQLEEDLEAILKELNPEADVEELEELEEALEERLDKEELKEHLIASMDQDDPEQEAHQEEYLEQLREQISEHLVEAVQATEDDLLEHQLLTELIYEDLPEVDNNIENALKRDDLASLAVQTLADKVNELAAETAKQVDRERYEQRYSHERYQKFTEKNKAIKQARYQAADLNASKEAVIDAVKKLSDITEETLAALKEHNPHSRQAVEARVEQKRSALQEAEAAYQAAKEEAQKAHEHFREQGKETVEQIRDSVKKHKETVAHKDAVEHVAGHGHEAEQRLHDKQGNTKEAMQHIQAMRAHAQKALAGQQTEAAANAGAVAQANNAFKQHQEAEKKLTQATHKLMRAVAERHKQSLQDAQSLAKKFEKNNELGESVEALKSAIREHGQEGRPKDEATFKVLKEKTAALDEARVEFAHDVNSRRKESLAKTEQKLKELKQLSEEVAGFEIPGEQSAAVTIIAAIRDEMLSQRINEKSAYLRERLKHGTESEKQQRVNMFKETAEYTVAAAQDKEVRPGNDPAAEGEQAEVDSAFPELPAGGALRSALARKVEHLSNPEAVGGSRDDKHTRGRAGFGGLEVDFESLFEVKIKKRWQHRRLSIAEKRKILAENAVTAVSHAPPQLRFARPTLDADKKNEHPGSADIYVGQINKREVAKLDPNRPRKSHPKFKDTDFAAVPFCRSIPKLDGDPSDWNLERTRLSPGKDVFMQWRPDGLYVLALVRDKSGQFERGSKHEMETSFWVYDVMELWFDMKNSKADQTSQHACQQFWACPKLPGVGRDHQLWEVLWDKNQLRQVLRSGPGKAYIGSSVHADQKGYNLEFFIPRALLTNLNYFRAGQVMGFLYAIDSNGDTRLIQSSLTNYNPNFHYSSQPKSWGNLQLLGTDAVLNTLTAGGEPAEYPSVEVSQSLGLMVDDPDSNTDIGAINAVTVRVRNRFAFDGRIKNDDGEAAGDWEDVRLLETGKNTGIFKGWVPTTLLPSTSGDQKIGVQPGDILDVSYNDYVRMAGEYDKKLDVEVAVVSPVLTVSGARAPEVK